MKLQIRRRNDSYYLVNNRGRALREPNDFIRSLQIRGLSPHTVRAYAYDLKDFFSWWGILKKVSSLQRADLYRFIDQQHKKQASPCSINRKLVTITLFYRFVTGKNVPADLPCPIYRAPGRDRRLGVYPLPRQKTQRLRVKVPKKQKLPLSTSQVQLLLNQFPRYRDLAICYLMLLCGLRAQEVLNIQQSDFFPLEGRLLVHGKGNLERTVPLPQLISGIVAKYRTFERPPECCTNSLFVVLQGKQRGNAMTVAGLRSLFRVRRRLHKLNHIHPHLLRHTFGSSMAATGMSLPLLQRLMGHAFPETTMQYINLSMTDTLEQFKQATEKIARGYK